LTATAFLLPGFAGLLANRRRKLRKMGKARIWLLTLICIWFGGVVWWSGCGRDDHEAPLGSYNVPVNLTSQGAASQTVNVVVVVQ
jgi:hypothetical protein